jgi:beta-lactamase class A
MVVSGTRVPTTRRIKRRIQSRRRVPPGQVLLAAIACALPLILLEGLAVPAGTPDDSIVTQKVVLGSPFQLSERLNGLEKELAVLCKQPKLTAGVFLVQPSTGRFADVNGQMTQSAASMIKVPVMVSLLVALDKQQVKLDQQLVIRSDLVGGGSGDLQWRPVGTKVSLKDALEMMIVISDNTATNLIIDLLGGQDKVNRQFDSWGLHETRIANWLPDFTGTNITSPYNLAFLLGRIDRGEILSETSRKYMYRVMERCHTRTLLPQGLPPGAKIAHKTGDIASMVGNVGIITGPTGLRYIIAVQVTRPTNDHRANQLIRDISKTVYTYLSQLR